MIYYLLCDNEDNSIRVAEKSDYDKSDYLKESTRVAGSIDGGNVTIDRGRICAARLDEWKEKAKGVTDLLIALGDIRPSTWSGPAMRKNRQRALELLTGGKVKAADAGVTNLNKALAVYIGAGELCAAAVNQEVYAFLKLAEAVTGRPDF